MRIGILTGGGDVPGLNPCIKAVVNRASMRVTRCSASGAAGRRCSSRPRRRRSRQRDSCRSARRRAHDRPHGRHAPAHVPHQPRRVKARACPRSSPTARRGQSVDFTEHAMRVMEHLGIDALIPIGGDDTLSFGLRLHEEGIPVDRDPQDHGQRRLRHRLLHRLLDRGHSGRRVHPRPADAARLARAHRRGRAVRPLLRRDLADHRLSRRRRPRRHLRGPFRYRTLGACS